MWDVAADTSAVLLNEVSGRITLCPDRKTLLVHGDDGSLALRTLDGSETRHLPVVVDPKTALTTAMSADASIVAFGFRNGDVAVVHALSREVHRFPLQTLRSAGTTLAIHSSGNWIAVSGSEGIKLFEIPHGRPAMTLPHADFMKWLRNLSSARAIKDDRQPNGYRIDQGAVIPNWQNPPTW